MAGKTTLAKPLTVSVSNPLPIRWVRPAGQPADRELLATIASKHGRPRRSPGGRAAYSNIGYLLAGQVIERRVEPGSLASPGMPLLVLEQEGRVLVEAPVEESRASSVTLGDTVSVDIEALGKPVAGRVGEIVPTVDVGSRAFLVKVDLPSELVGLRPGMFARVSFRVGRKTPLVVPASAITRSGALDRLPVGFPAREQEIADVQADAHGQEP